MTDSNRSAHPGLPAPAFTLPSGPGQETSLADFRGRPTVLAFYPADWSPVCSDQMLLYQLAMPEFDRFNAILLGVSVDSVWSHQAFAEAKGIKFPLLSDFEPKGGVARQYGVYMPEGFAARALFLIGPDGDIAWRYVGPINVNPGADIIIDALEELSQHRQVAA
nr:redoxin domain-containing protein [Micromonospora sp. DSM 115978]